MSYTEANYENALIEIFRDTLSYNYLYGPDISRDYSDAIYMDELTPSLKRINKDIPQSAINECINKLRNIEGGTLLDKNRIFMNYLQNGVSVNCFNNGNQESYLVKLADYNCLEKNTFTIVNQWTIVENSEKRPDLILFLNGIPIVVFELKSPSREETSVSEAYNQLRNYMYEIPSIFNYNAFLVMSDLAVSKAGTITSSEDRFMEWKTKDGSYENTSYAQFDTFIEGMFDKARLLDIIKNFICFSENSKILSAYHQYFAVRKAIKSTLNALESDGKAGVFWHTQGSGKSLSMLFYAHLLCETINSPTILVLTDRNYLDDQLFSQFSKCKDFLYQVPNKAESREHLKKLLAGREANGIIFSTIQKFEESTEPLSERKNIIIMADEAHRGQYGLDEKVDKNTGRISFGIARIIRDNFPNATYIGFTGTPISLKDRSTIEVFGNYIDIYDMTQAVEDGATRPVYYESRVIKLNLDNSILEMIDKEYEILSNNAEIHAIEKSKKELGRLESILGADQTIDSLTRDIVMHYEENRQYELTGKAMIVAYSRPIAMKIYHKILELKPEWEEKVYVVMTSGNNDPEDWRKIIGNKRYKDELAKKFKDNGSSFKIAIVVDMWLTGFDVPSLATMYIYKPMSGHNLMQAIARVNRVYKNKEGGLIVDYIGIAGALKKAMSDYTKRDKVNYGESDISKIAYPKFIEKLEVCRALLHGFDYSSFMLKSLTDLTRAKLISGGVNFLSDPSRKEDKKFYIKESLLLRQSVSLCRSILTKDQRLESAYFEALRTLLTRITGENKPLSLKDINKHINDLLKESIKSDGIINLFSDIDIGVSIFDEKFLEEVSNMKEKNLAVEMLKKLLNEQISVYKRNNIVKSQKFSEMLNKAMRLYINGMITNEEIIEELLKMARDISRSSEEAESLGLSDDEMAFYDALTRPEAIKDFYTNQELVALTRMLTDSLRRSRTIDWQKKDTARAKMRRMVRKLLKDYDYPPKGLEDAVATVLSQCEIWADFGEESYRV